MTQQGTHSCLLNVWDSEGHQMSEAAQPSEILAGLSIEDTRECF